MPNNRTRKTPFRAPTGAPTRRPRGATPEPVPSVVEEVAAEPKVRAPRGAPTDSSKRGRHKELPGKPERLHKLLAQSGVGSRREMEELIAAGRVNVNGETAQTGQSASPGDRIKVNGKLVHLKFSNRLPRVII